MKIGLVVPGFSAGPADWCIPVLVDVVRQLTRGAEVHVFALRYPDRRERYRVHGAEVHALGGGTARRLRRPGLLASACRAILAEHRRGPFAALHGVWADEPGFVAVTAARLLGIRAIVSVMGGEFIAMPDIGYGGYLSAGNRLVSTIAVRRADCVTAGSTAAASLARGVMGPARASRLSILPWGVDRGIFGREGPARPLEGDIRILHVASLAPIKDQATLFGAFARLKGMIPASHLHIVGDGPLRPTLRALALSLNIDRSVTFHGHVDRSDLAEFYRAAHVVAVSSRYEAQLVVAQEAALCGVPLVGTAVGILADWAPGAALVVPIGDDQSLAENIRAALQRETAARLSETAYRHVTSSYLAPRTADSLLSLYRGPAAAQHAATPPAVPPPATRSDEPVSNATGCVDR